MSSNNEEASEETDNGIKVILVGEAGTGKTSLINSIQGKEFIEGEQMSSMTCSYIKLKFPIEGEVYKLRLWDTIGQEQYRSLTKMFLNCAKIVIFVFDITNKESFQALDFWYDTIESELGKGPIKGIAANKQDLYEEQIVEDDTIEEYANNKGLKFVYTTATNPVGFKTLLEDLLKKYLKKIGKQNPEGKNKNGTKLKKIKGDKQKKKKCC